MRCLVTAGKHINDIQAIARQPPIITEGIWEAVFSVGSAPRLYSEAPRQAESSAVQLSTWLVSERVSCGLAVESSCTREAEKRWRYSRVDS
jgi:predicted benzoate:H+ symporter BenE